jgi:hypothetical protein
MTTVSIKDQIVTADGRLTQNGYALLDGMDRRLRGLEGKLAAVAAITGPTGGATVDAEARTAINAIIGAA